MNKPLTLTSENFNAEVLQSEGTVVVDYWAPWCGPCRQLNPVIDRLTQVRLGEVKVGKVNVDDEPELARQAGVRGIPNVVLYIGGEKTAYSSGVKTLDGLSEALGLDALSAQAA